MNMYKESSIKKQQLWAFAIFAIPFIISFCYRITSLTGVVLPDWTNNDGQSAFGFVVGMLSATTTLTAYLILSKIATNRTTSILMRYVGFALFTLGIIKAIFYFTFTGEGWSTIAAQGVRHTLNWIPTFTVFYMLGTLERNNPNCPRTQRSVFLLFWLGMMMPMIVAPTLLVALVEYAEVVYPLVLGIEDAILLLGYYFLMTSEAFMGRKDNSLPAKDAYKIWNRYYKYFLWYLLIMIVATILLTSLTEII